jgi:NTE family protein
MRNGRFRNRGKSEKALPTADRVAADPVETVRNLVKKTAWRVRPPALALGGGGARGFAHFGVLQVLEESGLSVQSIVGTSMGAVAGGMVLVHGSAGRAIDLWREAIDKGLLPSVRPIGGFPDAQGKEHPLIQVARRIRNRVVISFAMNRSTILESGDLERVLDFLVPDVTFADLPKKLVVVATDLETGEAVCIRDGSLREALVASSAIPGVVPAVRIGGRLLVDGGVVAEVPAEAARNERWPVVAVDVSLDIPPIGKDDLVLDTMMRTQMMTARLLRFQQLRGASHVIRPGVGEARWAEWQRFDDFVEAGRVAARTFLGLPAP